VFFEGFTAERVDVGEAELFVRHGGSGPPLLLLHGHPRTHATWHRVADLLASDLFVVCPDLRGYGRSSVPPTTPDHAPYAKRAMAGDMVALMRALGHERFAVVGHDRGARVAYRMALDHPGATTRVALLDIIPTSEMYARTTMRSALGMWHWFFLPQPYDLPERLLGGDPDGFYFKGREELFAPEALAEYQASLRDPAVIHTICEDYRAGATFDRELDEADKGARRITCPVLILWGATGPVGRLDPLSVWAEWADDVRGGPIDCGHHIPEEAPEETVAELREFFG
jgi:haloacetate dehalogenase